MHLKEWPPEMSRADLTTVSEAALRPRVLSALDRAVARANTQVSRAESIRKFTILSGDFTEANGLLTPSLKVKRAVAVERFSEQIDAMYLSTER